MNILKNKFFWIVIVVLAVVGVLVLHSRNTKTVLGAVGSGLPIENYVPAVLYNGGLYTNLPLRADNGLQTGSSGTNITQTLKGICTSFTANTVGNGDGITQLASSTKPYDCAVTGVVAGDVVVAQLSTTTAFIGNNGPWDIVAAKASTTSGFITVLLRNNGAAAVPSALGVGSSTNYIIMR